MFGKKFFGPRYFGGRYWGHVGFGQAVPVIVGKPGAGKLKLPYFEPAWSTLKPQNSRYFVSQVGLFLSVRSTIQTARAIRSKVPLPLEAKSFPSIHRAARSFAGLGFQPMVASTVACALAVRSGAGFAVGARTSVAGSISRESRAALGLSVSTRQHIATAQRSPVPLFMVARSSFANRQYAVSRSQVGLMATVGSTVECATTVSRVAEMDRRDIDLILLLAA
ncbi:MAG: hypothetical protein ACRENK_15640 [Gemmatimonadaceae bacterium]